MKRIILGGAAILAVSCPTIQAQMAQGQGGQGQVAVFSIPRVEAHTLGLSGVTRRTLMAGPLLGGMGQGLGGAGGAAGFPVNPNPAAARAMLLPEGTQGTTAQGTPRLGGATLVTASGEVVPIEVGRPEVAKAPVHPPRPQTVVWPRVTPASSRESAEEKDARVLAHQQEQARQGSPSAQWALSQRYERGEGVEASAELAKAWKTAAIRSGYQP
jgi:hypothetical protein